MYNSFSKRHFIVQSQATTGFKMKNKALSFEHQRGNEKTHEGVNIENANV